ncbi:type III pantothenate kinase [Rhodanobacter denitrificans]|uniref:type III pantothenate kinase n=1 Tax=Rhodanobacter denitrificans TaxID=666685 RepID=UPI000260E1FC|nr:type III pantothenate kinase [Rhodanobacter denitrificans]EIM00671.1 pantothenate kinase, type III [Rhodanobacter denitrificans]UJM90093.1 type III pantothenate kinase [Rhodanobacter denitrificans]
MRLLLDLGNTRLKWALQAQPEGWLARGAVDWQDHPAAALASAWAGLPRPARVLAASVVDAAREAQVEAVAQRLFDCAPTWLRTPAHACGVRNAYAEPQRLGVDRFLAMVAAHADGHAPCVLAGVGTALTLDALAADGRHLGGLIAPGPALMQQSLLGATAQVRPERPGVVVELADNTADAVASGCWHAAAALVERFATRATARLGATPQLILGGGDAASLLPLLSLPARLSPDSVLRGLAVWADAS